MTITNGQVANANEVIGYMNLLIREKFVKVVLLDIFRRSFCILFVNLK